MEELDASVYWGAEIDPDKLVEIMRRNVQPGITVAALSSAPWDDMTVWALIQLGADGLTPGHGLQNKTTFLAFPNLQGASIIPVPIPDWLIRWIQELEKNPARIADMDWQNASVDANWLALFRVAVSDCLRHSPLGRTVPAFESDFKTASWCWSIILRDVMLALADRCRVGGTEAINHQLGAIVGLLMATNASGAKPLGGAYRLMSAPHRPELLEQVADWDVLMAVASVLPKTAWPLSSFLKNLRWLFTRLLTQAVQTLVDRCQRVVRDKAAAVTTEKSAMHRTHCLVFVEARCDKVPVEWRCCECAQLVPRTGFSRRASRRRVDRRVCIACCSTVPVSSTRRTQLADADKSVIGRRCALLCPSDAVASGLMDVRGEHTPKSNRAAYMQAKQAAGVAPDEEEEEAEETAAAAEEEEESGAMLGAPDDVQLLASIAPAVCCWTTDMTAPPTAPPTDMATADMATAFWSRAMSQLPPTPSSLTALLQSRDVSTLLELYEAVPEWGTKLGLGPDLFVRLCSLVGAGQDASLCRFILLVMLSVPTIDRSTVEEAVVELPIWASPASTTTTTTTTTTMVENGDKDDDE